MITLPSNSFIPYSLRVHHNDCDDVSVVADAEAADSATRSQRRGPVAPCVSKRGAGFKITNREMTRC